MCWCRVARAGLFFRWLSFDRRQQLLKRVGDETIALTPEIGERGPGYLKQPAADHYWRAFVIDSTECFEKDARGQILSIFAIADPAKDMAIDQIEILLIHPLKLGIGSVPFCGGTRGFR